MLDQLEQPTAIRRPVRVVLEARAACQPTNVRPVDVRDIDVRVLLLLPPHERDRCIKRWGVLASTTSDLASDGAARLVRISIAIAASPLGRRRLPVAAPTTRAA